MTIELIEGDCREVLRELPDQSVNCIVTSPPYFGLRDYGVENQMGLEPTPAEFVEALAGVLREARRVLRDDGTLWLNLGDSYASSPRGNKPGDLSTSSLTNPKRQDGVDRGRTDTAKASGLAHKQLIGIPWRVAFALQSDGWYLRQDIIWHKPNPMPESVRDRCTKAHEYIFLLSKSPTYYFDWQAMQEPATSVPGKGVIGRGAQGSAKAVGANGRQPQQDHSGWMGGNGETRNRRSVWTVTTKPFKEAHFATFPPDLIEPCVLAGCPEGGTVLDPFFGAGTTGVVCQKHNRNCVGIELNPAYFDIAAKRLGIDEPVMQAAE
jgi:DNA modification methylase